MDTSKSSSRAPAQVTINPTLTEAFLQASVAAYADFEDQPIVPPAGYRNIARWTGWDAFVFGGQEERFGLLFQSISAPYTYIFAFRGTDSDLDAYEDLFAETTEFVPLDRAKTPSPPAYVAAGFFGIYTTIGGSMTQSMQQQVFLLIKAFGITSCYVTGHSLGSALSSLFTLDVRLSAPSVQVMNLNFASPAVGTERWAQVYAQQGAYTVRVFNYYDFVPDLPPLPFYTHVGQPFQCAFYEYQEWYPHVGVRHALFNYQTVLDKAVWRTPQVWTGFFPDGSDPSVLMISVQPPAGVRPDKLKELLAIKEREALARATEGGCEPALEPFAPITMDANGAGAE